MENIDLNDASRLLVPDVNEDSVDIYDGLEINSGSTFDKSSPNASQLKESMDLYEEIVTEEQKSRESVYSELKSRFEAAQNQIKELRRRLEQMEMQNTGLNTENCRLKKNISALLRTAKMEVMRKDAEIQRLNQLSEKGRYHRSHINNLRDQNLSSQNSTDSSKSGPPPLPLPPPHSHPPPRRPYPPPAPSSPPPPLPLLPASPSRKDHPPQEPSQPSRKESDSFTCRPSGSIEAGSSKASSHSHSKSSSRVDYDVPDKQNDHSVRKSSSCSSNRHNESDKQKYKHREEKCQSHKLSESTDRRHKTGSDHSKDCQVAEKNRSHKTDRGTGQRYDSRSRTSKNYLNAEGHHRSERARSPPSEILHSTTSSDDKKGRGREHRQDKFRMSTSDSEHSAAYSAAHSSKDGYNRDHKKIKTSDQYTRNSDSKDREKILTQHGEGHRDSSKEWKGDRLSKNCQRKEDRRHEDAINRKHKRSSSSETNREREKQRSKEPDKSKVLVCNKEKKEKTQEALKRSCKEPNITEKSSVEENFPNRKLCFMETLNLTLSPIKRPVLAVNASQDNPTPADKVVENRPDDDESSQPNVEDMCVIDELDSSEVEAGLEDVAEQSDIPKTPGSEKVQRHEDVDHVKRKERIRSETPAADKQLEDHLVQTTSAYSQPLDTAETGKPPERSSLKAANWNISKNCEDKTKFGSNSQVNECGSQGATDGVSDTSGSASEQHTFNSLQKVNHINDTDQVVAVTEPTVLDSNVQLKGGTSEILVQKSPPVDSVEEGAAVSPSRKNPVAEDVSGKAKPTSPTILPQDCQEGLCPPASSSINEKDADAVSSTISLESLPQEGLSLPEAIYILTRTSEDATDSSNIASEPSSSTGCIAVSKVSSTTEEMPKEALPKKYNDLTFTPKKNFSPGKSHENNSEPSSSVPLLHDEDSMMRTLSNLKRIPDAISPLRSPVRITKRSYLHVHGKPGHVKSLEKDFSGTVLDGSSKKLDVNKENKYPGSPAKHDTQNLVDKVSDLTSILSDNELEEGEILSESDEAAAGSPAPATKRAKLAPPVRNKPSPKTALKRTSKEQCVASKETNEIAGVSTQSPKSRFKTVCPAATKASFSTIEEVMETFKLVRTEIRKKYMKLHKTFPKKSFYGVMDNFRESFLEFVDGAHFGQISSQQGELKSKLKKLIASVFSKVSNNGIVKRIFEQQAVDLKQKLWDFVDVQVDYLFRDVYTTMKSLCKPIRAQANDNRPIGKEKVSRQPPAKNPQCHQKEAQCTPTNLNQDKPVAPYKTGLGSRGKDIRITHVEKDKNVDLHPTNCLKAQTANFLHSENISSTPEKNNISSLAVSQNGSLLDKTDFELLTEQQASSLTFNLVRDTQMGEIFKCLLQGSDLLETNGVTGDTASWSLGTPRKDGERFISITTPTKFDSPSKLLSPSKFDTPSKLIATWSSISPRKISSPRSKGQIPLNPALFDESCLLEVPSENRAMLQSSSQKSYSILAEDLAVSLTIPSPLKSDSHLSFLQPSSMHIMSTPDSVISAHISEDALLDGEDATEQDIHLALDTDNSSCGSSSSVASEVLATPFVFKPDLPMQALVMEKSNDHFILKIRQTATSANTTLTADDSLGQTLTEEDQEHREDGVASQNSQVLSDKSPKSIPSNGVPSENNMSNLPECPGVCQAVSNADIHLTQDESPTLGKDAHQKIDKLTQQNTLKVCFPEDSQKLSLKSLPQTPPSNNSLHFGTHRSDKFFGQINQSTGRESIAVTVDENASQKEDMTTQQSPLTAPLFESENSPHHPAECSEGNRKSQVLTPYVDSKRGEMEMTDSERSYTNAEEDVRSTPEKDQRDCGKGSKRKKHHVKSKAKRSRKEEEESTEEMVFDCKNDDSESKSSPSSVYINGLYAKNVIRKKGEVVMSWSRDEDRAILIDLKTKGASRETFSALSERLSKPSGQIAHRFYQLMKLYKKQEKRDT